MNRSILLAPLFLLPLFAGAQTVTTYAGQGDPGYNTNVSLLSAKFDNPYGVAFDSKGRVFVTDMFSHVIYELSNGKVNRRSGDFTNGGYINTGEGTPRHNTPMGIAIASVDGKDTIFVVDNGNHNVRRIQIPPSGSLYPVYTLAGGGPSGGTGASGYLDANKLAARFKYPVGVAVSPDKTYLLVADKDNHVIRRISLAAADYGTVSTYAGKQGVNGKDNGPRLSATFDYPEGLFFDANGDLYVATAFSGVRKISADNVSTVVSTNDVYNPTSVVKVGNGLYIADGCNIKRWDMQTSSIAIFAGSDTTCDFADGVGANAMFNGIGMMAVSPDFTYLLVADQLNNRIRKVTITDKPSAVNELPNPTYTIFPNPAQNQVSVSGLNGRSEISLCDMTGRVITTETVNNTLHTMNLSNVSNGVYMLRISSGGQVSTEKIVVNR
jgi:hypothetical protein